MLRLHAYTSRQAPGDLSLDDLAAIWWLLEAEQLTEIFFHDGAIQSQQDFIALATSPAVWFYAASHQGALVGIAFVNNFSSSGTTAMAHFCSFAYGRGSLFVQAGKEWLRLLHKAGGLEHIIAMVPRPYLGARRLAQQFGGQFLARLPGSMALHRNGNVKDVDAYVYLITCANAQEEDLWEEAEEKQKVPCHQHQRPYKRHQNRTSKSRP